MKYNETDSKTNRWRMSSELGNEGGHLCWIRSKLPSKPILGSLIEGISLLARAGLSNWLNDATSESAIGPATSNDN